MRVGHLSRLTAPMAALVAALCLCATAGAAVTHPFLGTFNNSDSLGAGPFFSADGVHSSISEVAANQANGRVYVTDHDRGLIAQFDSAGHALAFTDPSLEGKSGITVGALKTGLAVDNSNGPSQGNIYVTANDGGQAKLYGYLPSGAPAFTPAAIKDRTLNCGVNGLGVDPSGSVWVAEETGKTLTQYHPDGTLGDQTVQAPPTALFCGVDFDSAGNLYAATSKGVYKYLPSESYAQSRLFSPGNTIDLSVDRAADLVYVDVLGGDMRVYSSTGELLGKVGAQAPDASSVMSCAFSISSGGGSGLLYSTDFCAGAVNGYGPAVTVPDISIAAPSAVTHTGATLNAMIDPAGGPNPSDCRLQWGASDSYESTAPCEPPAPYLGTTQVSASLSGLESEHTYHYRFVASTSEGVNYTDDQTFTPHNILALQTEPASEIGLRGATLNGSFIGEGAETHYYFQYGASPSYGLFTALPPGATLESPSGLTKLSVPVEDLTPGATYHYRIVASNALGASFGEDQTFRPISKPLVSTFAANVNTDGAELGALVNPGAQETHYHFDWGATTAYGEVVPIPDAQINDGSTNLQVSRTISGLAPNTTYHFRVVAENASGISSSVDRTFTTFATPPPGPDSCPNALARQQTGAARLLDCRAYELVSAADTGGYDIASDLVPGDEFLPGFPDAGDRVLYAVDSGVIPGISGPTNRGSDPYLATRTGGGWKTGYVGLPVETTPSSKPFASTLLAGDSSLGVFAFGGPALCSPCFEDGTSGIPVRLGDGNLTQGMKGSLASGGAPDLEGVAVPLSADGTHLIFESTTKFENDGNEGSATIYARNLNTGSTRVVSKAPEGGTMSSPGIVELDVSADGSRVLIGKRVGKDATGAWLYRLYMDVDGADSSIDLAPGAGSGVRYAGMSTDGSSVYFTAVDQLAGDADSSSDLFRATVTDTDATLTRISAGGTGNGNGDGCSPVGGWNLSGGGDCAALAPAGGHGVSADGTAVYFLSPEALTSGAVVGAPNLYRQSAAASPALVATLETTNPLVVDAREHPGDRSTANFQTTPDGSLAIFTTTNSLTGFDNTGQTEAFRYSAAGGLLCVSCNPTNARANGSASLAGDGLSITDDGRVFYTSTEPLVLRDTNGQKDVYEWSGGEIQLISGGTSPFDSGLLTVTRNGRDAYFFTHDSLTVGDRNGALMKIYDAREGGGFFAIPPAPACAASDECHGPGTQAPGPPSIHSTQGAGGNQKQRGTRRHKRHRKHAHHRRSTHAKKKAASAKDGSQR